MVSNEDEKIEDKSITTKISKKFKNMLSLILAVILALPSKIMAYDIDMFETIAEYGVEEPESLLKTIWDSVGGFCKFIIIPIILLIGSIVGLKKIKNGKGEIILDTIRIISIIAIIIMIILILFVIIANIIMYY